MYNTRSMKKYIVIFVAFVGLFLVSTQKAQARQGLIELRSTNGTTTRCLAVSMPTLANRGKYDVSVDCVDLVYPAYGDKKFYVMWANPVGGSSAQRLGSLGFGNAFFVPDYDFNSLFVTTENVENLRSPEGSIVMQGSVEPFKFLETPTTPTPTSEATMNQLQDQNVNVSATNRVATGLKRAGVISVFALIALFGLIFVITRSR